MNERCSAVLLNKLPSKEKDTWSFIIPCEIIQFHINNALADLGVSISLMPYTMYKKLGLGEPKATRISLELAVRSIQYPREIIENVLIKVDKFILLIDFVILDMPEDSRVHIILGRPFLAIARAMIDVFNKKITLRAGDNEVIFDVDQSIKRPPTEDNEYYGIDDLDDTINAEAQELMENDEPDLFLSRGLEKSIDQSDLEDCEPVECNNNNDSNKPIRHITSINTPYLVVQETAKPVKLEREHLYSASANEIDEKKPELKDLPNHLEYAYLHGDKSFPIIISSELSDKEKISLLQVLEKRKGAIAWKMSDIKGISPSYYTHKILMEDDFKPFIQPQRHLNPKVQDVVKNEIVKLLDFGLIYPVSDSSWVSPIHIVPKKGGMTVVLNDNNELIPSRTVIGCDFAIGSVLGQRIDGKFKHSDLETFTEDEIADEFPDEHLMVLKIDLNSDEPWYADYVKYPQSKIVPPNWTPKKRRRFFSQMKNYFWDEPYAFKLCSDNIMRRCVAGNEIFEILAHYHSRPTGGHHSTSVTGRKVYESVFFWPPIFKDAKDYAMSCDACQRSEQSLKEICASKQYSVAIDYVSKWVEAQALPMNDARVMIKFLRRLFARFGVPKALISDRETHFCNSQLKKASLRGDKNFKAGNKVIGHMNLESIISTCKIRENEGKFKMHPGKLKSKWYGPNVVKTVHPYGTVEITDKHGISFKVNGQRLKKYHDRYNNEEEKEVVELDDDTTVLYKVVDIATYLVEYVKFWDDWEVDRYGNANLDYYSEDQYAVSIKKIRRIRACTHQRPQRIKLNTPYLEKTQYTVFKIWNEYNILEDIKRGPYSKKSPIRRIQLLGYAQEPDETLFQAWERFKELLMKCHQHYLTEMQEVILFYNRLDIPTRQILDSRGAIPTMTAADAKRAIQEMAEYS
ncbi:DNA-directed DNA polymerase [Tanacetum coccineum]